MPVAIREEMFKMADSAAPADPEAAREKKHQQIEQAMAGLNWIVRILRNPLSFRLSRPEVGPADKDKVLFWWTRFGRSLPRLLWRLASRSPDRGPVVETRSERGNRPRAARPRSSQHMERIAKKLFGVTSYSFRSSGTNTGIDDDGKREPLMTTRPSIGLPPARTARK